MDDRKELEPQAHIPNRLLEFPPGSFVVTEGDTLEPI